MKMGGQRLCWHCDKQLRFPSFAEVINQNGATVRVHKDCKPAALRSIKPVTARARQPGSEEAK